MKKEGMGSAEGSKDLVPEEAAEGTGGTRGGEARGGEEAP